MSNISISYRKIYITSPFSSPRPPTPDISQLVIGNLSTGSGYRLRQKKQCNNNRKSGLLIHAACLCLQDLFEPSFVYWRTQWHPTPVLLPGKSHGRKSLWAAVHGVAKSRTQLSDFTFTFHFHALEKEMATHSRVVAWRIPGTGEPGGLQSMGSHGVGHD